MFCQSCGKENSDGAKFCQGCGTPLETVASPVQADPVETVVPEVVQADPVETVVPEEVQAPGAPEAFVASEVPAEPAGEIIPADPYAPFVADEAEAKPKKKKKVGLIIGLVAFVLVIAAAATIYFLGVFQPESVKNAKMIYNASFNGDIKTFYDYQSPYYKDYMLRDQRKEDVIKSLEESWKESKESTDEDGITDFSVKGVKVEAKYSESEIKKIEAVLEEEEYECDRNKHKIQDMHLVELQLRYKQDGDTFTEEIECVMIKVKDVWYLESSLSEYRIRHILAPEKE